VLYIDPLEHPDEAGGSTGKGGKGDGGIETPGHGAPVKVLNIDPLEHPAGVIVGSGVAEEQGAPVRVLKTWPDKQPLEKVSLAVTSL
jgi:hypothetical protein